MGLIVLIVFWVSVAKLWMTDGPRSSLKFIVAWGAGLLVISAIGLHPALFQVYQAILAIAAWFVIKARS